MLVDLLPKRAPSGLPTGLRRAGHWDTVVCELSVAGVTGHCRRGGFKQQDCSPWRLEARSHGAEIRVSGARLSRSPVAAGKPGFTAAPPHARLRGHVPLLWPLLERHLGFGLGSIRITQDNPPPKCPESHLPRPLVLIKYDRRYQKGLGPGIFGFKDSSARHGLSDGGDGEEPASQPRLALQVLGRIVELWFDPQTSGGGAMGGRGFCLPH